MIALLTKYRLSPGLIRKWTLAIILNMILVQTSKTQINIEQQNEIERLNNIIASSDSAQNIVQAFADLGEIYYVFDMDTAASFMFRANKIAIDELSAGSYNLEKEPLLRFLSASLSNLGWYYMNKGKIEMALAHNFKSLEIHEFLQNDRGKAFCYQNIGEIYEVQGDDENALRFIRRAFDLHKKLEFKSGMAGAMDLMAEIYARSGHNDSALTLLLAAEALAVDSGEVEIYSLGEIYANIGTVYLNLGDTAQSILYSFKAADFNKKIGSRSGLSDAWRNLSRIDLARDHLESAMNYAEESLEAAQGLGFPDRIKESSLLLAVVYSKLGDSRKALSAHKIFVSMQDSMRNVSNERLLLEQEQRHIYQLEKAERDRIHDRDLGIENAQREQQKMITSLMFVVLVFALIFLWFLLGRYRSTKTQRRVIAMQNNQITRSLEYSRKIQNSLMPDFSALSTNFQDSFLFFEPVETVSGDFYWAKKINDNIIIVCADCTGHGVRGGFMSTVCCLLLEKTVTESRNAPAEILERLNSEILRALHQREGGRIQDGLDMAVCNINLKSGEMTFSGARNGISIVRPNKIERFKAGMFPIGGNYLKKGKEIERNFKCISAQLYPGDWLCFYTDGYLEQSGGDDGYPMSYMKIDDIMTEAFSISEGESIKRHLQRSLVEWQGTNERQDDVLIFGFRFKQLGT